MLLWPVTLTFSINSILTFSSPTHLTSSSYQQPTKLLVNLMLYRFGEIFSFIYLCSPSFCLSILFWLLIIASLQIITYHFSGYICISAIFWCFVVCCFLAEGFFHIPDLTPFGWWWLLSLCPLFGCCWWWCCCFWCVLLS